MAPRQLEGFRIGRYRVLDKIGEGGMGVVFSAYDEQLDRKVALKVLLPDLDVGERVRARFLREAQAQARLSQATTTVEARPL